MSAAVATAHRPTVRLSSDERAAQTSLDLSPVAPVSPAAIPYGGTRFAITLRDGRVFPSCRVQGCGGEMGCGNPVRDERSESRELARLNSQIARACIGKPLHVYEPEPGCVKLYLGEFHGNEDDETIVIASLVGTSAELAARS